MMMMLRASSTGARRRGPAAQRRRLASGVPGGPLRADNLLARRKGGAKRLEMFEARLGQARRQAFAPVRARVDCFTEERLRFQIPVQSHWQRPAGIASTREGVHVLTESPIGVHSFWGIAQGDEADSAAGPQRSWLHLDDVMPFQSAGVRLTALAPPDRLGLFLPQVRLLVVFSPEGGKCAVANLPEQPAAVAQGGDGSLLDSVMSPFQSSKRRGAKRGARMHDALAAQGVLLFDAGAGSRSVDVVAFGANPMAPLSAERVHMPEGVVLESLSPFSRDLWLTDVRRADADAESGERCWLTRTDGGGYELTPISRRTLELSEALAAVDSLEQVAGFADAAMQLVGRVDSYQAAAVAGVAAEPTFTHPGALLQRATLGSDGNYMVATVARPNAAAAGAPAWRPVLSRWLSKTQQTVAVVENDAGEHGIELVDEQSGTTRRITPIEILSQESDSGEGKLEWAGLCEMADGELATLQRDGPTGLVRTYQVDAELLGGELAQWKRMLGLGGDGKTGSGMGGLEAQGGAGGLSANPPPVDAPKHGKEDPDNTPHVGGNTWAGGTGGSNTAGLGGRGGPYRLDKGHAVHQVSEAAKREVDEATQSRARELNRKAFAERLQEIEMSEDEHEKYVQFLTRVEPQIAQLRVVLESLESRKQERTWLKNQAFGDLDDAKLVDGATGEKLIYKRRGVEERAPQSQADKPKRMRFVVDCSGSMYRFNGQDGRLERECELVVMVMEALDGFESRLEYSIVGHSGESEEIVLVDYGKPPRTRKERLQVCEHMIAHSQFCYSGDMTLEATEAAVANVAEEDADEGFVFVVSDANLRRYGIPPSELGRRLIANPDVFACAIFIASLGEEAERIKRELPPGRGHVVFDTADLPNLFREIFITTVLSSK